MSVQLTFTGTPTEILGEMVEMGTFLGRAATTPVAATIGAMQEANLAPATSPEPEAEKTLKAEPPPTNTAANRVPKNEGPTKGDVKPLTDADCRNVWIAKKDAGGTGAHLAACLKPFFPEGTAKPSITTLPAEHYQEFIDSVNAIVL